LFFDAGNTLLFPDTERTLASLIARGIRPTEDQLRTAERTVREYRDHHTGPSNPNHSYWNVYFDQLFSTLGLATDAALQQQLIASSHRSSNWRRILPDTRNILLRLKQQYRLAVISNSDGGIQDAISAAGIADCFECIIDSAHVGVEKPDPTIFRAGLDIMNVQPHESVYIGDVYAIDVLGARSVGMRAILIDSFAVCDHHDCPRISSLSELPELLRSFSAAEDSPPVT
jgi:HAD superfamily hydrolase (TIGR01509 family)